MIAVTDKATDNGRKQFGRGKGLGEKFSLLSVLISQIAFANVIYSIHWLPAAFSSRNKEQVPPGLSHPGDEARLLTRFSVFAPCFHINYIYLAAT